MTITGARVSGSELILTLGNPVEAAHVAYRFKAGEYEIKPVEKKRSLDANAYCWVLIHKIAAKLHEPPVEIYRRYIRDIGCRVSIVCLKEEDVELEIRSFLAGHIGRMADIGPSKFPGYATVHKKYGSSDYTPEEMAAFIDAIVQDCNALDIETKTQEDIEILLQEWRKGKA